jgi:hypothetical protein
MMKYGAGHEQLATGGIYAGAARGGGGHGATHTGGGVVPPIGYTPEVEVESEAAVAGPSSGAPIVGPLPPLGPAA